ncbi:MAG: type II toxin-antitoxin system RelE/ParE family toxin [Methanosarcinales archaeon]|nr:type II toxin-antitoxin system RelE/ParE family toxin [Methanosarcinales archaeon]
MKCFIEENCKRKINKACKKNPPLKGILESKISEILSFPEHFKPLKNPDKGIRRVHILKSFVLTYKLDDGIVYFIDFGY